MISLKRRVDDVVDADDVDDVSDVADVVDVDVVEGGQFGDGLKVLIEVHTQPTNPTQAGEREKVDGLPTTFPQYLATSYRTGSIESLRQL